MITLEKLKSLIAGVPQLDEGLQMPRDQFDMLKKGDKLVVHFDSSIRKGHKVPLVIKSKSRSAKYNVDKINLVPQSGRGKFTLYSRQGKDATLAMGDMATVMTRIEYPKGGVQKEEAELVSEARGIDFFKVSQELSNYGKKHGGIDKKDFLKVSQLVREIGKNSDINKQGQYFKQLSKYVAGMDTDPRDGVLQIMKKHGMFKGGRMVMEAVLNFDNVPKAEHPQFMKHVKKAKLKVKSVQGDRIVLDGSVNQFDVFFNSIKKDKKFMKEAVSPAQQAAIAISKKERGEKPKNECADEKDFKPHMMYDPKTGKGYKAKTYADHVKMDKMGYTHEKPEIKEDYRKLAQKGMGTESERDARVGLEMDFYDSKGNKQFGKITRKTRSGYTVRDEKGKMHSFAFLDRQKAKALLKQDMSEALSKHNTLRPMKMKVKGKTVEVKPKGSSMKPQFDLFVDGKARGTFDSEKKAMQHASKLKETKLDPADIDVVATDDDRKAADKNPVIQLRRIADLPRGGDMEFKNGKKVKLKQQEARRLLKGFDSLRKNPDKQKFQSAVGKDHATLKRILKMIR